MDSNPLNERDSSVDSAAPDAEVQEGFGSSGSDVQPTPKKKRTKLWVTLGVVAVVLVGAGIGGFIWHEQPSFCNAICHTPMDSYVEGYYSEDDTLLVTAHTEAGDRCLDCHEPTMSEQVGELMVWVSGDYQNPLTMTKLGTQEFCLNGECHDLDTIKAATEAYGGSARNPHDSHYGDSLECYTCHRVHRESTMYCNECHPDISGPDTWAA